MGKGQSNLQITIIGIVSLLYVVTSYVRNCKLEPNKNPSTAGILLQHRWEYIACHEGVILDKET